MSKVLLLLFLLGFGDYSFAATMPRTPNALYFCHETEKIPIKRAVSQSQVTMARVISAEATYGLFVQALCPATGDGPLHCDQTRSHQQAELLALNPKKRGKGGKP
jgi:hypothetical protein